MSSPEMLLQMTWFLLTSVPGEAHRSTVGRGGGMRLDVYNPLDQILAHMDLLAEQCPRRVKVASLGYSIEGRPLMYTQIYADKDSSKAAIFIEAGIHAREWIATASALWLLNRLVHERSTLPQSLRDLNVFILPVANPDGYVYSWRNNSTRLWRKNRRAGRGECLDGTDKGHGVDLNRNFGFMWTRGKTGPCDAQYPGPMPFSEPESKALAAFLCHHSSHIKVYLSLHSFAQKLLLPYGQMTVNQTPTLPPDYGLMEQIGQRAVEAIRASSNTVYQVGNIAQLLYPVLVDFAKGELCIKYSYTMELRDTGKHGFLLPENQISKTALDVWEVLTTLAQAVFQQPANRSTICVNICSC